jgi:putative tryptophan/tyrosine transport system substrate-binding protein
MKRLFAGLAVLLCAVGVGSAQAANVPLIGVLLINKATNPQPVVPLIRNALAALGYVEDRNLRLDFRFAEANAERFPALAEELVGDKATVIITLGDAATHAAQRATRTIPIVAIADDLVGAGLIDSMAQPGGNTTGISILATELDAKKLEILKEIVPSVRRLGVLRDPASIFPGRTEAIVEAGRSLGVELQTVDASSPADFDAAFALFHAGGVGGIDILASPMLANSPEELAELSIRYKLPAICQFREMVAAGCLASYGVKRAEMYAMLAGYIDKMLKGARPAETVARQPTALELVINRKTARKLGVEISPAILARADEVIE